MLTYILNIFQGKPWYIIYAFSAFLYFFFSIGTTVIMYELLYIKLRQKVYPRKIQRAYISKKHLDHEIRNSFLTLLIHSFGGAIVIYAYYHGHTLIYADIAERGYVYFGVSIIIMILMHDTYFYWSHRFMHLPGIFNIVHKVHHVSTNPSPFSAYCAHPLEAVISGSIFPIIAFTLPSHWLAISIYVLYVIYMSVMGHAGYEFYPRHFILTWYGKWQTTSTHHNMHHKYFKGNYGLYFSFWDKWMKTERKEYEEVFNQTFTKSEHG